MLKSSLSTLFRIVSLHVTDSADSAFHHENLLGMKVGWGDDWLKQLVWAPIEEQCSSVILVIVSKFY